MTGAHGFSHHLRTLFGTSAAIYVKLVYWSGRFTSIPHNPREHSASLGPVIVAAWHGQNMILPSFWHHQHPLEILVSRHPTAEVIATAYRRLGLEVIRGSGSTPGNTKAYKGGAAALRQMVRALKRGSSVALTADMPPGPARRAGRGIIVLAQISGQPILPMAVTTRFRLVAYNWCRFAINLPLSRGSIVLGQPIMVPRDADDAMLESKRCELEDALNTLTRQADELVGRKPHYDTGGPLPSLGMSYSLYALGTRLISPLASGWLARRLACGKEEQGRSREKLGVASRAKGPGKLIWLHATSVGEATSCLGLIEQLLSARDNLEILVTTTTVTAAEILAKRLPKRSYHQYAPLDLPGAVDRFLDHWQPDMAVFAESEIWPNTIVHLHRQNIPIALVNARLSRRSYKRWRKAPDFIRSLLARFDHISAQSTRTEQWLASLGARNTACFGNMKVDASPAPVDRDAMQNLINEIGNRRFWLAASTHAGEEEVMLKCHEILKSKFPDILTIIVPRHRERTTEISALIAGKNLSQATRSRNDSITKDTDIYLADTLGELPLFYQLSPVSFIGGSLIEVGGHNPVEAVDGTSAILHGPYVDNFKDIYRLLDQQNGAIKIADADTLATEIERLLTSEEDVATLNANARTQVMSLKGATALTTTALLALLDQPPKRSG